MCIELNCIVCVCWGFHCVSETPFEPTRWQWRPVAMPMSNGVNAKRFGARRLFCNPCNALLWHSAFGILSPLAWSRGSEGPCFTHCSLEALKCGSIPGMWAYMCTCEDFCSFSDKFIFNDVVPSISGAYLWSSPPSDEPVVSSSFTHYAQNIFQAGHSDVHFFFVNVHLELSEVV